MARIPKGPLNLRSETVLSGLGEMGVVRTDVQRMLSSRTQAEGEAALALLKAVCKKGFRAAARRLHPDRNENAADQKEKENTFKRLRSLYEEFDRYVFRFGPQSLNQPFRVAVDMGTTTTTSTGTYSAPDFRNNNFNDPFFQAYRQMFEQAMRRQAEREVRTEQQKRASFSEAQRIMREARDQQRQAARRRAEQEREERLRSARKREEELRTTLRKAKEREEQWARGERRRAKVASARRAESLQQESPGKAVRGASLGRPAKPGVTASEALFEEASHGLTNDRAPEKRPFVESDDEFSELDDILKKMGVR